MNFLDLTTRSSQHSLRMEQIEIDDDSSVAGSTLSEVRLPERTGLIVIALRKGAERSDFLFNPVASTRLEAGDEMIVLGMDEQIAELRRVVG